jgi:hypothetical protein
LTYLKHLAALSVMALAMNAHATLLTDLAGTTASAGSCYMGCGHASYDASNILDHDLGGTGNTGLNSWNSGFWGGYVQVDFQDSYALDRIELYGAYSYYDPFTLTGSVDGTNWFTIGTGGYHVESDLSQSDTYGGIKYGATFDASQGTMGADLEARYLRYTVTAGSPEWGYLFEVRADGHAAGAAPEAVPEPGTLACVGLGLMLIAFATRRRRA